MSSIRNVRFAAAVLAVIVVVTLNAAGQSALKLKPYRSFVQTGNQSLTIAASSFRVRAFPLTKVTCPATNTAGCSARIQVSTMFEAADVDPYEAELWIHVDSGSGTSPFSSVPFGMVQSLDGWHVFSFQWLEKIAAGVSKNIEIGFSVSGPGDGIAGLRTASIDFFLN